uniref:scavenger receptor cysteine-rich domain-containing protein DMBT1-like n=1 Tax=Semicossyphus pulcher TaxID=241346 RepID=UPI0037E85BF4
MQEATVTCREMNCGNALTVKDKAHFGIGTDQVWLNEVDCTGHETSLADCPHRGFGEHDCDHTEDAGLTRVDLSSGSLQIRLVSGTDRCSGRVEVLHDGQWGTVCDDEWDIKDAQVVCRAVDCGIAQTAKSSAFFGPGQGGIWLDDVDCVGNETSLLHCRHPTLGENNCGHGEDAGVVCSGSVRLADGPTRCIGRVEFYDKGQWGTVCGDAWDVNDAMVVCKQLDCGRAHKITAMPVYGLGTGQTWIDQIECNGMESTLTQCPQRPFLHRTCNVTSIAGVICTGGLEVRLANGKDECSGRVEVRHGEDWQTVCDTDWTRDKAALVCSQLECGEAVDAPTGAFFTQGNGSVVEASNSCFDNVTSLQQCSLRGFRSSTCGHEKDAGAVCAAQVRLVAGSGACSGRVEIHYKGQWGTVCDDEWEMPNADVVCKQLGCGLAVSAPGSAHFGRGSGPIWLDNVVCSGSETALTQCEHPGFGENNCGHGEDASVICLGALQKPQITLSPGSDVNWGDKVEITCTVATEHLGGTFFLKRLPGTFKMEKYSENEAASFVFPSVTFDQRGSYYCEYQKKLPNNVINYPQGIVAKLSVTVILETPSISPTSPHAMVVYSPDKISVNQGSSFSVTCATHSRYAGGYFYLTRSNDNITEAKIRSRSLDQTAECDKLQLVGPTRCSGRVEIFHRDSWGTVCDDQWSLANADVVCRELDCGTVLEAKKMAFFGEGKNEIWLDDVQCTDHVRIVNGSNRCNGRVELYQNGRWNRVCKNDWSKEEADVLCREVNCGSPDAEVPHFGETNILDSKPIRLMNGTNRCSGRVEVYHNGQWGTVCDDRWGMQEATVTCREMNCGNALTVKYKAHFGIGSPQIRLVNGTDRCSGRVEVLHDGQWGTVCDDEWDIKDAQVVCRAVDCGTAQTAKSSAFFGPGQGGIWLDDVGCVGNETSLLHCRHPTLGENNCGHGEDAGVVCSASIRLINGTDQCSGRVEFHHGGRWSPAFYINWGMSEAEVVCRMMNCGDPVKVSGSFGRGKETRGYRITCNGREGSLSQCTLRDYDRTGNNRVEEAGVQCSGSVRLADGPTRCIGRVEFYDKGQWGTVCGDAWDVNDAMVVCKQLDCGRAHKITAMPVYGLGTGQTWIDQIECNGMESTLTQCPQRPFLHKTCNVTSIAGVICTGGLEVRLANGKDECSGRVEVRHGEDWQTVCDTDWTRDKAAVVCSQLECGEAVDAPIGAFFTQGNGSVVEASNSCFDNVTSLQQCSLRGFRSSTCGHEKDAGAVCAAQVRLVAGSGACSGRVEIHYKGQWGTVCDDEWEMPNADVVCKQLGCGLAVSAPGSAHFGRGSGPIWLDNVVCSGSETALTQCEHPGFGENNCGHGEDASVICLGALQKPQITLSPGSDVNWGDKVEITCTVATEHLGGTFFLKRLPGTFKMEKYSENEAASFVFPSVTFDQRGSYYCEYQKRLPNNVINYPQGIVAKLSVTVILETPSISLTSPHAMVVYSPDKISVNQGSSFSVTCATHSRYAGGYFYLTRSNDNITEAKQAFGHTIFYLAYFEFPAVDYKHQGDYKCVYAVNISSETFCSVPSKSLQVTVISAASSSSAVTGVVVGLLVVLLVVILGYLLWRRRWQGAGNLVQFSKRFGGAIKPDSDERSNGAYDGRARNAQVTEQAQSQVPEDKSVYADTPVESVPEDLAGRVCYELEPLVLS